MRNIADFHQQMTYWGFALDDIGDITTTISEQRHPNGQHRAPTMDVVGRPLWDDPSRIENVVLLDRGRRCAIPYWWALPGVTDGLLRGLLEERRHYHEAELSA